MYPHPNLSKALKRSFFLLEVLLSLCLLSLCLAPLLRIPSLAIKKQRDAIAHLEEERLSNLAFAEAKSLLYSGALPWEEIENAMERTLQSVCGTWKLNEVQETLLPDGRKAKNLKISISLQGSKCNKKMRCVLVQ